MNLELNHNTEATSSSPGSVKGFICPTKGVSDGDISFKDCLAHALAKRNRPECGHRYETLAAIAAQYSRPDPALQMAFDNAANGLFTFRVTQLTNPCSRSVVLERFYPQEYITIESQFYLTRGIWKHKVMQEFAPPGSVPVGRLSMQLEVTANSPVGLVDIPVTITGEPDSYVLWAGPTEDTVEETHWVTLTDYKSTEFLPREPKPEHVAQVNIYNELLRANGWPPADALEIHYFSGKDEQPFPVPIWSSEQVQAYLQIRTLPLVESLLAKPDDDEDEKNEVAGEQNFFAATNDAAVDADDSWLPARLNPLNRNAGGWKCDPKYCNYAHQCWPGPGGVPGLNEREAAKEKAEGARRRTLFGLTRHFTTK